MSMATRVDIRPDGRIIVTLQTDAAYNPDCALDMCNRAGLLVAETMRTAEATWATPNDDDTTG